jgi:thiol-disulfide isomerase/thioredoxin
MKRILILIFFVSIFFTAFLSCSNKQDNTPVKVSTENILNLKDFTMNDLKEVLHTSDKKVIIVNFWATWCPECRTEIPDFVEFYDKFKSEVKLIGVSLDESKDELKNFIKIANINYPVFLADKKLVQHLMINAIPVTFLFKNGKYVKYHVGRYSFTELKKDIEELLHS